MPISFDQIPANLRTPGVYIEFNNELAGATGLNQRILVLGQRLAAGTVPAGVPTRVNVDSEADRFFGRGSMLAEMLRALKAANRDTETWAIALDDDGAGVKATGTILFAGTPTEAGVVNLYIAGKRLLVAVAAGASAASLCAAAVAAINADTTSPVTAAVNGTTPAQADLSARHKGEHGNYIDLRTNYYQGERTPAGLNLTLTAMGSGAANPSLTAAIVAMGGQWWNWIAMPYTDGPNLGALDTELSSRWGPMRQSDGRAICARVGTTGALGTFSDTRNSPQVTVMGVKAPPQPPWIWAAVNCGVAALSLSIDPARPLQTLILTGLLPPAVVDRFTRVERNVLLYDGIATYTVEAGEQVRIERQITTYQTNQAGIPDASYLDIETPETLSRLRFEQRARITQKYPRHKLADDGTQYGAGQAIVTPSIVRGELLALYRELEALGWVEDFDAYKATIVVERDPTDRNRMNVQDRPNLVNQYRVHAQKVQFVV